MTERCAPSKCYPSSSVRRNEDELCWTNLSVGARNSSRDSLACAGKGGRGLSAAVLRLFQSAPRERGESKTVPRCHPNNGCFNPRPASGAKVMCGPSRTFSLKTFQSAPRERGESSARGNFTACPPTRFNPRPASGAKGITCSRASPAAGFNPRPASGAKGRSSSNR